MDEHNKTYLIDEDWVFTASPNISFRIPGQPSREKGLGSFRARV